jgi:hypothetical protein
MKKISPLTIGVGILLLLVVVFVIFRAKSGPTQSAAPTPTPESTAETLPPEKHPKLSLQFTADAHYVTVNISNLFADQVEYNLIYDATVKGTRIQTGVNASTKLAGKSTYTQKQLLGSESSGKFTYHSNIQNAFLELTLRDTSNRSVFTATYPFEVKAASTQDLVASE